MQCIHFSSNLCSLSKLLHGNFKIDSQNQIPSIFWKQTKKPKQKNQPTKKTQPPQNQTKNPQNPKPQKTNPKTKTQPTNQNHKPPSSLKPDQHIHEIRIPQARKKLKGMNGQATAERGHSNEEKHVTIYPFGSLWLCYETQGSPALTWTSRTLARFHNYYGKRNWPRWTNARHWLQKTARRGMGGTYEGGINCCGVPKYNHRTSNQPWKAS